LIERALLVETFEDTVMLPCAVSNPSVTVNLYKVRQFM
jgi:hypothetical protein